MSAASNQLDPATLGAVALGGAVGALARFAVTVTWPGSMPVLAINVLGCLLMGLLLAATDSGAHRLVRPFLGTGVLGGFTTVSTYAVLTDGLLERTPLWGITYLVLTPVLAVAAAAAGTRLGRRSVRAR